MQPETAKKRLLAHVEIGVGANNALNGLVAIKIGQSYADKLQSMNR